MDFDYAEFVATFTIKDIQLSIDILNKNFHDNTDDWMYRWGEIISIRLQKKIGIGAAEEIAEDYES